MNSTDGDLRARLTDCRDRAVNFIRSVEARYSTTKTLDPWELDEDEQTVASGIRADIRSVATGIAETAQSSILIGDADLRALGENAKRMSASLHFRSFRSWGIYIHHNEGTYLGTSPAGQAEDWPIFPEQARIQLLKAYDKILEVFDFMSAKRVGISENKAITFSQSGTITYRPGTAFIIMWINPDKPELNDVKDVATEVFKEFGVTAMRADELQHADGITDRIIQEIKQSEFLFADLTGERPSVYYELGFAHAIGKSVMLFRKKGTNIHFDVAYRNCPEYGNLGDLRRMLRNRLQVLTDKTAN